LIHLALKKENDINNQFGKESNKWKTKESKSI